jgi:enoyl-CoA hydratase/carnithine racemase
VVSAAEDAPDAPLLTSRVAGVAWLRLNRPDQRNAISLAMRAALEETLASLDEDDTIRVAVLTGVGSAFCAGVDLKESSAPGGPLESKPVTFALERFGKPLIAAINGPAVGGGLELALAADLRIASTSASFALPEVKIGSLPGSGGTQRLARATSDAVAAKMVFTGEPIDSAEALRCGLVSDVVEPADLPALTESIAAAIAGNAPLSLRAAKIALRAQQAGDGGLAVERALWAFLSTTDDRREGRAAFGERRPPRFEGS